jgi:hypothetical protein
MMGGVLPETCWAIKKHWNNKFYCTVASCWFFLWDLKTLASASYFRITEWRKQPQGSLLMCARLMVWPV